VTLNGLDRAAHPRVGWRQKPDKGNEQNAGVEFLRAVALNESADVGVERLSAHLVVDLLAYGSPSICGTLKTKLFNALYRAVKSHPGHDLGIRELLCAAAHFPNTLVRLGPNRLEMLEEFLLKHPASFICREFA